MTEKNQPAITFIEAAREFCDWIETGNITDLQRVQSLLATLHCRIWALTALEPDTDGGSERSVSDNSYKEITTRLRELPIDFYWEALDPLQVERESIAIGSLVDDLADIWRDLKNGLLNYDSGRVDDALLDWKTSFEIHWGKHLTAAQWIIHQFLY